MGERKGNHEVIKYWQVWTLTKQHGCWTSNMCGRHSCCTWPHACMALNSCTWGLTSVVRGPSREAGMSGCCPPWRYSPVVWACCQVEMARQFWQCCWSQLCVTWCASCFSWGCVSLFTCIYLAVLCVCPACILPPINQHTFLAWCCRRNHTCLPDNLFQC